MPFFAPLMLFGLVAAAAPILLHLMRRRNARRVMWGAWQFLADSMRHQRCKILLEEIVLLVVRTAILACAALAFARPYLPEMGFFGGGEKDVVIVLDCSGSMNLKRGDGTSAFDAALAEARELVDNAPRGVSFGLVLGGRDAEVLTVTPFSSKREVLKLLDGVKAGTGTMDAPRALEAAGEILSGGSHTDKEVILFGDGQAYGWRVGDVNAWRRVDAAFASFGRRPAVVWRTLERPAGVRNMAISAVVPSQQVVGDGSAVSFAVTVVNSGSVAFSPGELSLSVDGRRVASQPVGQVLPGLSRTIPFACEFKGVGHHDLVAALAGGDDIASDNAVTNAVEAIGELKVLLVDGRPGAEGFERPTAYLEAALRPELKDDKLPFLVRPVSVRPSELEATNVFGSVAVTVLCDVPFVSDRAAENLARWTAEGGGLLVVPGERTLTDFYSNWTWRAEAVLPTVWTNFTRIAAKGRPPTIDGAPIAGRMLLDEKALRPGRGEVALRFSDGEPALVTGRFHAGRVGMIAVPLDFGWTALPARPLFVPFVHRLVYSLSPARSFPDASATGWNAREGDVAALTGDETDELAKHIDLSFARLADDVTAAVVGRGFGIEIWRPLAIVVLLLMIAEILLCRAIDASRAAEGAKPKISRLRFVLRAIAFLAMVWMLLHLVWTYDRQRKVSRKVAVLVDRSLSMRRYDLNDSGLTNAHARLDLATNAAARLEAALGARYDVENYSFGDEVTDFSAALEDLKARVPPEELAGAVFVTDGRPTAGADVDAVGRLYARQGAKVTSVIVGNITNRADLAIQDVCANEKLFLGEKVNALVQLRADKLKGAKGVAKFMLGDRELGREEFEVDAEEWTKELRFSHEPAEKGVFRYRVVLEGPATDLEPQNDVWPFDVAVSDDRTNVLLVDRRPRWEFRYLRNLFYGRDKSVHLQYVLTDPDKLDGAPPPALAAADATRKFGDAEAGCLPSGRDAWRRFDVIVLGDVRPEQFLDEEIADLRYCVEERGATLVFISGGEYMPLAYAKDALADLMPVTMTNEEGRVTAAWRPGVFGFAVTGAGYGHEIMALSESEAENVRIWESGCEWTRRLDGLAVKPGAETLAFAGDSSALKSPLLVVQHRGRGKVVFLASDETWRFRYRIGDTYHHRFWGNLLAWSVGAKLRDGNAFARAGSDRLHYAPGEPVKLRVRLSTAESLPLEGMKVVATVKGPKGAERELRLAGRGVNGVYEGVFDETDAIGDYRAEFACKAAARELGDKWPTNLVTTFSVRGSFAPVEYTHLSSDRTLADELAKLTGGEVIMLGATTNEFAALGEAFGAGRSEVTDHLEKNIWDHPAAFVVMALALIVAWILRKRKGLA